MLNFTRIFKHETTYLVQFTRANHFRHLTEIILFQKKNSSCCIENNNKTESLTVSYLKKLEIVGFIF